MENTCNCEVRSVEKCDRNENHKIFTSCRAYLIGGSQAVLRMGAYGGPYRNLLPDGCARCVSDRPALRITTISANQQVPAKASLAQLGDVFFFSKKIRYKRRIGISAYGQISSFRPQDRANSRRIIIHAYGSFFRISLFSPNRHRAPSF